MCNYCETKEKRIGYCVKCGKEICDRCKCATNPYYHEKCLTTAEEPRRPPEKPRRSPEKPRRSPEMLFGYRSTAKMNRRLYKRSNSSIKGYRLSQESRVRSIKIVHNLGTESKVISGASGAFRLSTLTTNKTHFQMMATKKKKFSTPVKKTLKTADMRRG